MRKPVWRPRYKKMRVELALLACGLVAFARGFYPQECHCQRENVSCSGGGLDIIPITLNPMMKRLSLKVKTGFIFARLDFLEKVFMKLHHDNVVQIIT